MKRFSRITGTGSYLPPRRVTNAELVARLAQQGIESSDQWIRERTGIRGRHFAEPGVFASDLGVEAARNALESAGVAAREVDLIIIATSTPDMVLPSTATILQRKLGVAGCPAFDVQAVCSGFVYALTVADAMIRTGTANKALVIGAEVFDGKCADILCVPGHVSGGQVLGTPLLRMDGQAVFKLAVGALESAARAVLEKAGRTDAEIDWLVPHQANIRIMHGTAKKLKLPLSKVVVTVDEHGNTSAASIPLALDVAVRAARILKGDTVMLEGVGGGFTWGAVLLDL